MSSTIDATAVEKAYGLLWLSVSKDARVHEARRTLAASMSFEERKRGVMWVSANRPPVTESEISSIETHLDATESK